MQSGKVMTRQSANNVVNLLHTSTPDIAPFQHGEGIRE